MIVLEARVEEREALKAEFDRLGEVVLPPRNVFGKVGLACACEGCETREHLVKHATERPDVRSMVILVSIEHFWRHYQGSSQSCCCQITLLQLSCEA